ncbi:hypothetical protein [Flavobacterium dankookense]|uniref:Uncharacterized protein n=1 Tax=Flavobacterium dankookense TaxID=706186 RepID=A0A4R6Q5Y8_9FLAO|nr:hypothetical protein [Flavobacterium dankookense]TDP57828.1 hypothetical protein BC748_2646 [Flavobacterium dankookense]
MKKSLLILVTILSLSCNEDENNNLGKTALNLVTGINFRETSDDTPLQLGNPNVLVNNSFVVYPNPANQVISISSQENITDIWFVKSNPQKIHQNVDFSSILNSSLYAEQLIVSNSNFSINGQSSNGISLNIGDLEKGYYKVFVKIGGVLYWDNLYKYENQGNNEEQFNAIINFWD